jgi:predicted site-specific integrase-resolvase
MQQTENKPKRYLTFRQLGQRYGDVHVRTIERWTKTGKLPPATKLPNGRNAIAEDVIEVHERGLVGGAV